MKNYFNVSKILLLVILIITACEKDVVDSKSVDKKEYYFSKVGNGNFQSLIGNGNVLNEITMSGITGGVELWSESISSTNEQGDMLVVTPFVDSINTEVLAILYTYKQGLSVDYNIIVKTDLYNHINNISTITDKTIMTDLFFINLFNNNLYSKKDSMYLLYKDVINDSLNVSPRTLRLKFYVWVECCPADTDEGCKKSGGGGPGENGMGWGYWKLVDSHSFGNFGNRGYNGTFFVGQNGWFYPGSNYGGAGEGSNSVEVLNRYLTTDKILNCLGSSENSKEELLIKLKRVIGNCKTIANGTFETLALQLSRRDQSEWKNIIYEFLKIQGLSDTCMKSIFLAENCQNNSPSECAIKMSNFQNEYGTLGMDEDEFVAFWISSGCNIRCEDMEKCLLVAFNDLTNTEWNEYKDDHECKNLQTNKAALIAAKAKLSKAFEDELRQLSLDFPGQGLDGALLKELMQKVVFKKAGKIIPFVGAGFDLVALEAAYLAGDFVGAGLALGSLAMNVFPCGMLIELGFDAAGLGNIIFKSYKSLSELKVFLGANSTIFEAIFKTIDDLNLIDALEWVKKGSSNIGQFSVSLGGKTVNEFLELLATKLNVDWVPCPPAMCISLGNGITISSYIDSSFNGPAIQIVLPGNVKFKIRLQ